LLGRITLILNKGKPCTNAEKNSSVEVALIVDEYNKAKGIYLTKGKYVLLNEMKFLQMDISIII